MRSVEMEMINGNKVSKLKVIVDYDSKEVIEQLKSKKPKDLKPHEKFVLQLTGEYGCKDFFLLKDLQEYNPDMNLVASNEPLSSDGDDY